MHSPDSPSPVTLFEDCARAHPDRIAVSSSGRRASFGELDCLANRVADVLTDRLGTGNEPVGILLEGGVPAIAALLGVLKSGRPFVPLDPRLPRERGAFLLEDSTAAAVVTDEAGRSVQQAWSARPLPIIEWEAIEEGACRSPRPRRPDPSPDTPAWILYTSGSTGRPKGVVQSRRNVVRYAQTYIEAQRLTPEDRLSLVFSFSANFAQHQIFAALSSGVTLHPFDVRREGFHAMAEWLANDRITVLWCVPTVFRRLAEPIAAGRPPFPHLRLVMLGGEPVRRSDWEAYRRLCPDGCVFVSRFGASETGTVSWFFAGKQTTVEGHAVPIGYAAPDYEVLLLNEQGAEVTTGEIGEIAARSRYLSPGYWRRPDLTGKAFRPDPHGEGGRLFLTGDLGRMGSDGCLTHLGRTDFQVKVRGYRIELGEVEYALSSCPGVRDAVVMGRTDADGQTRLVAWIVADPEFRPGIALLRRHLEKLLPDYMVPAAWVFVDRMPLAPNGKIHRGALPDPPPGRPNLDTTYAAPQSPMEQALAGIWGEALGIGAVGVDDDFLELGGNSIVAARIRARVTQELGFDLTFRDLIETSPTVRRMAAWGRTVVNRP